MDLWLPPSCKISQFPDHSVSLHVSAHELAEEVSEQATDDEVWAIVSTLTEARPELFANFSFLPKASPSAPRFQPSCKAVPRPSSKRLRLSPSVALENDTPVEGPTRPRPSSARCLSGSPPATNCLTEGNHDHEDSTWGLAQADQDSTWGLAQADQEHGDEQRFEELADSQNSWRQLAEKRKREQELAEFNQVEDQLDVQLLQAAEAYLRELPGPQTVWALHEALLPEFHAERPWLTDTLKARVRLRRELIESSYQLVWLPGKSGHGHGICWDPSKALGRSRSTQATTCVEDEAVRTHGRIKSYNMSAGYGFLVCDETDLDIYFHRSSLPGTLQKRKVTSMDKTSRRSDWFQGFDVTFVLDMSNPHKPQGKNIEFAGALPEE